MPNNESGSWLLPQVLENHTTEWPCEKLAATEGSAGPPCCTKLRATYMSVTPETSLQYQLYRSQQAALPAGFHTLRRFGF